jgi:hypothetical protein
VREHGKGDRAGQRNGATAVLQAITQVVDDERDQALSERGRRKQQGRGSGEEARP